MNKTNKDTRDEATPPGWYANNTPRQFNFARRWRKDVAPHLDDPFVKKMLTAGLMLGDMSYRAGDPPWLEGRSPVGHRVRKGCLSWYQPWGKCHYIAPFCWALGQKIFPDLTWGFVTSDAHTVAIGYRDDWKEPEIVMDILWFRAKSAHESLEFAKSHGWRFYRTFAWFAATHCDAPESVVASLQKAFPDRPSDVEAA